ncbi:hypothetical protein [Intrasporangium sp.]|uniref:hypothetical protein n=1 Tax=Intrasporangium sp. TaxID=1925024 RepID=UPI00293A7D5A|nr:hypothetical protein [Intrasporangium sp.]MDV3222429.1 hypothetical protein [Intrasporangium sp.]
MPSLPDVARAIDGALPFVTVSTEPSAATTWVGDVIAHAAAGADPLAPWRRALVGRQHSEHKPHVAAAFVLQWWCDVVATPLAYAAELGPWVLLPSPMGLGFELAPGLHPSRIVLLPGAVEVVPREQAGADAGTSSGRNSGTEASRSAALEASSAAYDSLVGGVARHFAPDVKMSSRQRWGVVSDRWVAAVRAARVAAGRPVGPEQQRISCCFIVALPGMKACAACPRHAPS